jgi:pilus assembly protein TadC
MSDALLPGLAVAAALVSFSTCRPVAQRQVLRVGALAGLATSALLGVLGASVPLALAGGALAGVVSADRARRGERRRQGRDRVALERALPDALDLLAGLVEACTNALSASSRRAAFGLLRRSGSPDLARVGQALALADELGTGVAEQLRGQALVQRDLRRSRAREQAGAAAPKIALVIGLLLVPAALSLVLGAELLSALAAANA